LLAPIIGLLTFYFFSAFNFIFTNEWFDFMDKTGNFWVLIHGQIVAVFPKRR